MVLRAQRRPPTLLGDQNSSPVLPELDFNPASRTHHQVTSGPRAATEGPKHSFLEDLSFQEELELAAPAGGQGALSQGVSCSNLAGSTHCLLKPSKANFHNAQLF